MYGDNVLCLAPLCDVPVQHPLEEVCAALHQEAVHLKRALVQDDFVVITMRDVQEDVALEEQGSSRT